jgi:hypothetical protein
LLSLRKSVHYLQNHFQAKHILVLSPPPPIETSISHAVREPRLHQTGSYLHIFAYDLQSVIPVRQIAASETLVLSLWGTCKRDRWAANHSEPKLFLSLKTFTALSTSENLTLANVVPCSLVKFTDVSQEHTASIFSITHLRYTNLMSTSTGRRLLYLLNMKIDQETMEGKGGRDTIIPWG